MKKILILSTLILILNGCGGGSSDSNSNYEGPMEAQKEYTLYTGDKVIKDGDSALVQIEHKDGENKSRVILIQGQANILRKP